MNIRASIIPNNNCNLSCEYCFQKGCDRNSTFIDNKDLSAFFSFLRGQYGITNTYIDIIGGEPFLYPDKFSDMLSKIVNDVNDTGKRLCIYTNGTIYNEKIVKELKKIKTVQLIITSDINDTINHRTDVMKNSYFKKIEENISKYKNDGFIVSVGNSLFSKTMLPFYEQFVEKSHNDHNFFMQYVYATDLDSDFSRDDVLEMCNVFYKYCQNNNIPTFSSEWNRMAEKCCLSYLAQSSNIASYAVDSCPDNCLPYISEIAISPNGYIIPCSKSITIEDNYSGLHISNHDILQKIKNRKEYAESLEKISKDKCGGCFACDVCHVCDILNDSHGNIVPSKRKCERASEVISAQLDFKKKLYDTVQSNIKSSVVKKMQNCFEIFQEQ